ncbi:MAG: carboxypeptidase-like regulatory domain-containing protein [Candidatus Sumerlaeaceae bacterium]|nr:carboxypeptidase-like regulatory domain-containing protein [Candidatus Sumerlaeaceae bacterium]
MTSDRRWVGGIAVVIAVAALGVLLPSLGRRRSIAADGEKPPAKIVRVNKQALPVTPSAKNSRKPAPKSGTVATKPSTSLLGRSAAVVSGSIFADDSTPIGGAEISISVPAGLTSSTVETRLATTTAGADGTYKIAAREVPAQLLLRARAEGYADACRVIDTAHPMLPTGDTREFAAELRLHPASRIAGKVLDAAGSPVPGANVAISVAESQGDSKLVAIQTWSLVCGADGAFASTAIPAGEVTVEATAANLIAQRRTIRMPDTNVLFQLAAEGNAVDGYVFDDHNGEVVSGATVRLTEDPNGSQPVAHVKSWSATSNADGTFHFTGLPEGNYRVSANKEHLHLKQTEALPGNRLALTAGQPAPELHLRLYGGHTIVGKVTETDTGAPIEGAGVTVLSDPPAGATTDPDGTYRIRGVPADGPLGIVAMSVQRDGYSTSRDPEASEMLTALTQLDPAQLEATQNFQLHRQLNVSGRVRNEAGLGIFPAQVAISLDYKRDSGKMAGYRDVACDGNGYYSLLVPPGNYVLRARAPGYGSESVPFQLDQESKTGLDLILRRGATVEGVVVDFDGSPVTGADVETFEVVDREGRIMQGATAFTDSNGIFSIGDIRGGMVRFEFRASGYIPSNDFEASLEPGDIRTGIRIKLQRARKLAGRVEDSDGKAIRRAVVALLLEPREGLTHPRQKLTDETGHFAFTQISDEKVGLMVTASEYNLVELQDVATNQTDLVIKLVKGPSGVAPPPVPPGTIIDLSSKQ